MGGHGGLNILPQKKWNVYNWDNREIVDRDKKEHEDKKRKQYEQEREHALQNKMSVLKQENPQALPEYQQREQRPTHSLLNLEMRKMADEHKHINLFQEEEKILMNRDMAEIKRLKEEEFLKGKNMDYSSRFLGSYNDKNSMPWYSKKKGVEPERPKNKYYKNLDDVIYGIKTDSRITKEVIQAEKRHQKTVKQQETRDRTRQKKYKRYEQYQDKCARMEAKQSLLAKDLFKHEQDLLMKELKDSKQKEMQKLRQKRLKREQKERRRIEQLKKKKQN